MQQAKGHLRFRQLPDLYAIVRLDANAPFPSWATHEKFTSITRTTDELSIVCPVDNLPADIHSQYKWVCLKLEGPFPFSQTGILLSFIEPLSNNAIPIFAVSTFDTDYVFVQQEFLDVTLKELSAAGHTLEDGPQAPFAPLNSPNTVA
jgi:hypothetical protein